MQLVMLFRPDHARREGVRPIKVVLLRILFLLMFVGVGYDAWSYILGHTGPWDHVQAVAWCMFAAYSTLSILGVFRPLRMLPIMLFMLLYKSLWLIVVAYPLWSADQLVGSPAEKMARVFIWAPVAILAIPWRYTLYRYVLNRPIPAS